MGFGFRVSGFGFRVSGFGFRISGFAQVRSVTPTSMMMPSTKADLGAVHFPPGAGIQISGLFGVLDFRFQVSLGAGFPISGEISQISGLFRSGF